MLTVHTASHDAGHFFKDALGFNSEVLFTTCSMARDDLYDLLSN